MSRYFPTSNLRTNHRLDLDRETDLDEATREMHQLALPAPPAADPWQEPPVSSESFQPPGTSSAGSNLLMIANTQERASGMTEMTERFDQIQAFRNRLNEESSQLEAMFGLNTPQYTNAIQEVRNGFDALDREELLLFLNFLTWLRSIDPIENCMSKSRAYPYVPNSRNIYLLRTVRAYRNAGEIVPIDLADNMCSLCHSDNGDTCGILPCGHTFHPSCFFDGRVERVFNHLPFVQCFCGRQYNLVVVPAFRLVVDVDAEWYQDADELKCLWTEH